jgi:hypothetical protein
LRPRPWVVAYCAWLDISNVVFAQLCNEGVLKRAGAARMVTIRGKPCAPIASTCAGRRLVVALRVKSKF